jgi:FkbM family methyltransferase
MPQPSIRSRLGEAVQRPSLYDLFVLFKDARQEVIRECGIQVVLDVGANAGQYAMRLREDGYAGRIISFEPIREVHEALAASAAHDDLWETRNLALGADSGLAILNISENTYSSSFFPIADIHVDAAREAAFIRTEQVDRARLDSIDIPTDEPILLKMDVQGYEPEVIRGAGRLLENVAALEVEMSLVPIYHGQELAPEVCRLLRQKSFVPVAIDNAFWHPRTREILAIDGLFRRITADGAE